MSELIATGISEEVISMLERQGLPVRKSLKIEIPPFPADVTEVDDQELMVLASRYMENYNFLTVQVACAAIAELEAENAYDRATSYGLISKTTGKTTEKAVMLKASVSVDPEIIELHDVKTYAYAYRKMLETTQDALERYYYLASRELTRRTSGERMKTNRFNP